MRTSSSTRRSFLSVLAGSAVVACAPFSRNSPFWGTIYAGIDPPEGGDRLSRTYVDSLPYASMAAWFDGAPKSLLVLASFESEGRLVWHSADRQSITTQGPFVVQSIGTELELRSTSLSPGIPDLRRADGMRAKRIFDVVAEGSRARFTVNARFTAGGIERHDLLGQQHELRRYAETVTSDGKPRYRNDYWIDEADGFCWKSRQIVVPTMPHLNLEILKRANPAA